VILGDGGVVDDVSVINWWGDEDREITDSNKHGD
jgi:hypothetical protein